MLQTRHVAIAVNGQHELYFWPFLNQAPITSKSTPVVDHRDKWPHKLACCGRMNQDLNPMHGRKLAAGWSGWLQEC